MSRKKKEEVVEVEPVAESVAEPVIEPVAGPVTEPMTEPMVDPDLDPTLDEASVPSGLFTQSLIESIPTQFFDTPQFIMGCFPLEAFWIGRMKRRIAKKIIKNHMTRPGSYSKRQIFSAYATAYRDLNRLKIHTYQALTDQERQEIKNKRMLQSAGISMAGLYLMFRERKLDLDLSPEVPQEIPKGNNP
jgi:hypothetical protein